MPQTHQDVHEGFLSDNSPLEAWILSWNTTDLFSEEQLLNKTDNKSHDKGHATLVQPSISDSFCPKENIIDISKKHHLPMYQ